MARFAVRVHPLDYTPEVFYYLDIILDYPSMEQIFQMIAFGEPIEELQPYHEEMFMRHFALIPEHDLPYSVYVGQDED